MMLKDSSALVRDLFENNRLSISAGLERDGYFILRNEEVSALVHAARGEYLSALDGLEINAQKSRFNRADLSHQPWRKMAIGATNGVGEPYAQFLTSTYFSESTPKFFAINVLFGVLLGLRDILFNLTDKDALSGTWNACRIHHYPRGGGFMSMHKDTHFPKVLGTTGMPFLQVSACMSRRGIDFQNGGGFVVDKLGNKVDLESYGAIVMFDGNQPHGVDCIDLDVVPDIRSKSGRLAAFTNIYEILD
ncbi:hypothetical protein [Trinickia sp.]|uniref:hypothetical protein n=1 Tax=Trinickia sp. TaxID=2571163 RepID=UPI003F8016DC